MIDGMQHYISVQSIQAEPMIWGDFVTFRMCGELVSEKHLLQAEGYRVHHPDGRIEWWPKAVFERACLPIRTPDHLTQEDMSAMVTPEYAFGDVADRTVIVTGRMRTGFEITESASVLDPEKRDVEQGAKIAMSRIGTRLGEFMSFVFCWAKYGLSAVEDEPAGLKLAGTEPGAEVMAEARRIAESFEMVIEPEASVGFFGRTRELEYVMADGETEDECRAAVLEATTQAVATLIEEGGEVPAPVGEQDEPHGDQTAVPGEAQG